MARKRSSAEWIRVPALGTFLILAIYWGSRFLASQCIGASCDMYIPFSLLLPVAVLIGAALTGLSACSAALRAAKATSDLGMQFTQRFWLILLGMCTFSGVIGPIIALVIWRDHPDVFIFTSSIWILLVLLSALGYSWFGHFRLKR